MSGYEEIPGTNVPRKTSAAEAAGTTSSPFSTEAAASSTTAVYHDIPGTNVPRKTPVGDVIPPGAFTSSTFAPQAAASEGAAYTDIPGTNMPRKAQFGASGEPTGHKIMDEIKGVFASAQVSV